MSWVKIDDQFPSHPKVMRAGLEARALYITALCYCAQHLTDGFVTHEVTPLLTAMSQISNGEVAVKRLVEVGLWEVCEDGYMVHDYLFYNPTGDKVKAKRRATADRQAKYRGKSNAGSNGVTDGVSNTSPVPVPVLNNTGAKKPRPTPKPRERDELFDAIASVTHTDPATAGSSIGKVKATLLKANPPYTPSEVLKFGADWPAWKDKPPTLWQLQEQIGNVRELSIAGHAELSDESIQGRKVYR